MRHFVTRLWLCLSVLLASLGGTSTSTSPQTADGLPQRVAQATAAALAGALTAFTATPPIASAQSTPSPPFTECPAVGFDTSCGSLLVATNSGITVLRDSSQGPYEGADDTLVGVLNNSSSTVTALQLSSSGPIFGFDGDGLCTQSPRPSGCPFGATGYEGPGTSFSNINGSLTLGQVNFSPGIAPGGTAYFSLETQVLVVGLPAQPVPSGGTTPVGVGTEGQNPPNETTSTDPVNTFTGNYAYTHTDVAIPGRGPSPVFVRSLNTLDTRSGPLGAGWTHNYNIHLANPGDGTSDVLLVGPDGRTDRYVGQAGTLTPPPGINTRLVANANGTYTVTLVDQTTWSFNAQGQLTAIADRYGNQSTMSYTTLGQLASVTDPAGRGSLTFGYDATTGLLTSVTDWSGRVVHYGYDTNSPPRLLVVSDRNNQVTTYGYVGATQQLASIIDANNHIAGTMTYDSQGRVVSQKDARGLSTGQQTSFSYGLPDAQGNVTTTVTYPATSFDGFAAQQADTYNNKGQITQHVMKPSATETLTETYVYSASGFRSQVTDPRGNTTSFCYDVDYTGAPVPGSLGNLTRTISPPPSAGANPLVTLIKYDARNNVVETVAPKGVPTGGSVTCSTNLIGAVNSSGFFVTDLTYDTTLGTELLSISRKYTDPELGVQTATTRFAYSDPANPGMVTTVTSPRSNPTTLTYYGPGSQAGLLGSVRDPLGNTTSYTYDLVGRRTTLIDPLTHSWTFQYDNEDRLTQASAPPPSGAGAGLTTSATFDLVGNRLSVTDANGQITRYQYDERDSLKEVDQSATQSDPSADAAKIRTTYSYDNLGNLSRVLRAAGDSNNERATDYTYDGLNRVRNETQYPSWPSTSPTLVTQTTYDADSNRSTLHDPNGNTTTFSYDTLNRLTNYSGGVSATYTYDANGNRASMADSTGTTTYTFDEVDRLLSVTSPGSPPNPGAKTVGYRYDLDGNRRKLIYPDNTAVNYSFDAASRLQSLTDWANRSTSYSYFADGLVQTQTNFNGTTTQFTYDNARRLTQVWNQKGATTISQHTYTLDNSGNRTQLAEMLPQVGSSATTDTLTYGYDHLYRLTSASTPSGSVDRYTYDPVGDRLSRVLGTNTDTYAYDRADRIISVDGIGYQSDANGNLTNDNFDVFSYDAANRFTGLSEGGAAGGNSASYAYDGDGKRVQRNVFEGGAFGGGVNNFGYVYDVESLPVVLEEDVQSTTTSTVNAIRKYIYGLGLVYIVDQTGAVQVVHADGLGSTRALTDTSGQLLRTYQTDEFGVPSQREIAHPPNQPFQYTGEQRDYEFDLYYLRARMYDPQLGRFLQRDPVSGGTTSPSTLNRYSYVSGDPTTLTDRSGLCSDPGGPNIRYCIAAFIPGSGIGPFQGDNRGPNATSGNYRMRIDIKQTDTGTTVANVTPGVSRLQIEPDIARTADVIGCGAAQASNTGKNRLFLATCSASAGLLFHLSPPLMFSLTILESQSGSFSIGSAFGTLFPSLEIWQYGNGSPNGYWYNSGPASSKIGVDNAITELLAIDTVGYLRFQPATP